MDATAIGEIQDLLTTPKKIVIVPHKNPDGDAIGSSLGLLLYLKKTGQSCTIVSPNDYPGFLKWMPGEPEIVKADAAPEKAEKLIQEAELIFTLDFNHFSRTGELEKPLQKAKAGKAVFIMIDHHRQPDDYANYMYSDIQQSSTCQMVYHFLEKLKGTAHITPEIATCLYTGIMTDTGSFRFASTTSDTHKVLAHLIEKGAKNSNIHQQIFDTNSIEKIQLLGVALKNMRVIEGLHTAYITLSQKELDAHHFKKGDTEGFVNYGLSVKGIKFAAIFIENKQEGIVKISLRSKGKFDVNTLAREHFEGGGHLNAAGGKSDRNLSETVTYFKKIVPEYKSQLADL